MAYIEQDTLMRRIKEIHCAECDSYHGVRCRACWVDDTLDYIDSEPAADVAPVVHGQWITEFDDLGWLKHTCTVCGYTKRTDVHVSLGWNYCPNCGAIMDGGDD